jgi:signal transduction histidine kinase
MFGIILLIFALRSHPSRVASILNELTALALLCWCIIIATGFAYADSHLLGVEGYTPMAFPTCIAFSLISCAIIASKRDSLAMTMLSSDTTGGIMLRSTVPAAIFAPILLRWMCLLFVAEGADRLVSDSVLAVISGLLLVGLLCRCARQIDEQEAKRLVAEHDASQRITQFHSTISHELRTPMTSIMASLKLLSARVVDANSPEGAEMLKIADDSSERLLRLINDLLDMNKLEAGRTELVLAPLSVLAVFEQTTQALQGFSQSCGVSVQINASADLQIVADQDRMQQILINLASNAIKFSKSGAMVLLSAERKGTHVELSVTDTGAGIAEHDLPKLFGKFQQLDSQDTRNHQGSGLGLFISKSLVELHGGSISVDSTLEVGTTVRVLVRAVPELPTYAMQLKEARPTLDRRALPSRAI